VKVRFREELTTLRTSRFCQCKNHECVLFNLSFRFVFWSEGVLLTGGARSGFRPCLLQKKGKAKKLPIVWTPTHRQFFFSPIRGRVDFAPFQQGVETLLLGAILKACFCLGALMGEKKN